MEIKRNLKSLENKTEILIDGAKKDIRAIKKLI